MLVWIYVGDRVDFEELLGITEVLNAQLRSMSLIQSHGK